MSVVDDNWVPDSRGVVENERANNEWFGPKYEARFGNPSLPKCLVVVASSARWIAPGKWVNEAGMYRVICDDPGNPWDTEKWSIYHPIDHDHGPFSTREAAAIAARQAAERFTSNSFRWDGRETGD
jgi:hypothetical protein